MWGAKGLGGSEGGQSKLDAFDEEENGMRSVRPLAIAAARKMKEAACFLLTSWLFWLVMVVLGVMSLMAKTPLMSPDHPAIQWSYVPLNVTRAVYVTMEPGSQHSANQIKIMQNLIGFPKSDTITAVDGKTVDRKILPMYTRYLMDNGRHDHSQVSTPGMVGCYLSHLQVLRSMKPGDIYAVFEEDAGFAPESVTRLQQLDAFFKTSGTSFDVVMIGINRLPTPKGTKLGKLRVAEDLYLYQCSEGCSVWGTRGYVMTFEGAQKVLQHAEPIITQIDALFSLVASYEEDFKFFWLSDDVAVAPHWLDLVLKSKVQDNCLKCYMPTRFIVYVGLIIFCVVSCCAILFAAGFAFGPLQGWTLRMSGILPKEVGDVRGEKGPLLSGGGDIESGKVGDVKGDVDGDATAVKPVRPCHRRTNSRDVDVGGLANQFSTG